MASLDDPETWPRYGELHDKEFSEVLKQNPPRRFPPVDLNDLPNVREAWAEGCRKGMLALLALHEEVVSSDELFIPLSNGNSIRCLRLQPKVESSSPRSLIVLIHGGGFLFGTAEMEASVCINSVAAHGCIAISLEYSLAPEHKFPVAYEECWEALQLITANEAILGVDLKLGFILGGTSSGGQTTAALSHWARDRGLSPPLTGLYMNSSFTIQPEMLPSKFKSIYQGRNLASDGSRSGLDRKTELAFLEACSQIYHRAYRVLYFGRTATMLCRQLISKSAELTCCEMIRWYTRELCDWTKELQRRSTYTQVVLTYGGFFILASPLLKGSIETLLLVLDGCWGYNVDYDLRSAPEQA